jgi:hypothetical protein
MTVIASFPTILRLGGWVEIERVDNFTRERKRHIMGGGSFNANSYRSYTHTVASKPREEVFASRHIHKDLDPKGVKIRESRDSADNPNATPIIVGLDVTGSMGKIAEAIAKGGLGTLFNGILDRKPVSDPHLMFMGIGDAHYGHVAGYSHKNHDDAPLQVSQFEADNRIVEQLTNLWLEGGGGGNSHESYDLAWYFAARHTVHDAMVKRGKRGYLFTVGDEETPDVLRRDDLERVLGYRPEMDVPAKLSLEEARRKYNVFHVIIEEGNHAQQVGKEKVQSAWKELLGQHVISLSNHELLAETIVAAIQVAEGADHAAAASGWGGAGHRDIIGNAVSSLPRGVPAPRQLGR